MTKRLEIKHTYPTAAPEQLRIIFTDPTYLHSLIVEFGGADAAARTQITGREGDGKVTVTVRSTVPRNRLPALVRRFVRADLVVICTETWTTPTTGTVEAVSTGHTGHVRGDVHVSREGDGALLTARVLVSVKFPIVGGVIERLIVEKIDAMDEIIREATLRWIDAPSGASS